MTGEGQGEGARDMVEEGWEGCGAVTAGGKGVFSPYLLPGNALAAMARSSGFSAPRR